jgi:hypothetical protein
MSKKVNTSESILNINETNDKKLDLGSAGKGVVTQTTNGIDLLNGSYSVPYALSERFEKLGPDDYSDEMKEYGDAMDKDSVLQKYNDENHIVNQPTQKGPNKYIAEAVDIKTPVYESMYKDKTCAFFLGSISFLSLYVIYKFIERE